MTGTELVLAHKKAREFDRLAPVYDLLAWMGSLGRIRGLYATVAALAAEGGGGSDRAVDLCCGTGGVARALAPRFRRVEGVDLSAGMLRRARRRPCANVVYAQGDILRHPLPGASLDALTCSFGLHELSAEARRQIFGRAAAALRAGGRFVVCDYRRPRSWAGRLLARVYALYAEPRHFLGYLGEDLPALAGAAGLRLVDRRRAVGAAVQVLAFERAADSG